MKTHCAYKDSLRSQLYSHSGCGAQGSTWVSESLELSKTMTRRFWELLGRTASDGKPFLHVFCPNVAPWAILRSFFFDCSAPYFDYLLAIFDVCFNSFDKFSKMFRHFQGFHFFAIFHSFSILVVFGLFRHFTRCV